MCIYEISIYFCYQKKYLINFPVNSKQMTVLVNSEALFIQISTSMHEYAHIN